MNNTERRLVARQYAMHRAGEKLEAATMDRDLAIQEAVAAGMAKAEIARLLGVRRETVYNALARVALNA